jgi:SEC-C motif-containing protein
MELCPCGSSKNYDQCCEPFITATALPNTPEELMRSRYTAYTQANTEYIAETMKAPANRDFNPEEARSWAADVKWLKLEVVTSSQQENEGTVEFIAQYSHEGKRYVLHELSLFRRDDKQWYYVDGNGPQSKPVTRATKKIARNDPCSCGSQKKYKKCCGNIP